MQIVQFQKLLDSKIILCFFLVCHHSGNLICSNLQLAKRLHYTAATTMAHLFFFSSLISINSTNMSPCYTFIECNFSINLLWIFAALSFLQKQFLGQFFAFYMCPEVQPRIIGRKRVGNSTNTFLTGLLDTLCIIA